MCLKCLSILFSSKGKASLNFGVANVAAAAAVDANLDASGK